MEMFSEEIKAALQNNDQALAAKLVQEQMENIENVPLFIAVTGESGSGKSTFVNALRGVDNTDEGAAATGVEETTMEPTDYCHPNYNNIKIWDLPGVGTTKFTAEKYLEHVGFEKFDFFIIVSDTRFRENDAKLAQEIQKMKKKFYFVRSKIDQSMADEKRHQKEFNEENTLKRIRDNCIKELQQLGVESPKVFLVSSFDLHLYEFKALWETLAKELPQHQHDVLLLLLPNISVDAINKKKKALEDKIKWCAFTSAINAAVPIPGTSLAVDIVITMKFVNECQSSLGLTYESLLRLSSVTRVPIEDLKAELKSPLSGVKITKELLMKVLSATLSGLIAVGEGARFVPLLGIPIAMSLSGFSTYKVLQYLLNSLADDAQRVFTKALGLTSAV